MVIEFKRLGALVLCAALLAGCKTAPNRAPIEDRGVGVLAPLPAIPPVMPSTDSTALVPGTENASQPGYYTVKPGDTLIRIALENGQNWKDLVRWNGLENPNVIEVGLVLRVMPPGVDPSAVSARPVTSAHVETRPLDLRSSGAAASSASAPAATVAPVAPAPQPAPATAPATATRESDDNVNWAWPAAGAVVAPFDEGKVKGLSIGGKAGDPVFAAADGRVVYAGSGLRGYGNLIILKHNNTYLTAYAHNQTLFVKEDQTVRRGQKIAEMGSSDADGVKLHFEIRKQGKPIDPGKLLPPR